MSNRRNRERERGGGGCLGVQVVSYLQMSIFPVAFTISCEYEWQNSVRVCVCVSETEGICKRKVLLLSSSQVYLQFFYSLPVSFFLQIHFQKSASCFHRVPSVLV